MFAHITDDGETSLHVDISKATGNGTTWAEKPKIFNSPALDSPVLYHTMVALFNDCAKTAGMKEFNPVTQSMYCVTASEKKLLHKRLGTKTKGGLATSRFSSL